MIDSAGIAIATVHSMLIVTDVVGNCLVCVIVKKNRDMRTPMNYLLVNLAVADILYAVFITPDVFFWLTSTHPDGMTGTVLCKTLTGGNIAWIGAASSFVTLTAISVERYYAVVHPFGDKGKITKRKLKVIILGSWIFSCIICVTEFMTKNVKKNVCVNTWPQGWLINAILLMWFLLIVICLSLMVGFYSKVVYTLWFKRNNNQLNYQQRGVMRVRKRVTLMVVTITALFGICWLTDIIVHVVEDNTLYTFNKNVYTVIHTMILFSSAVNPFVYALINQTFRQKIKGMLCDTLTTDTAAIHLTSFATQETNSTEAAQATDPTTLQYLYVSQSEQ